MYLCFMSYFCTTSSNNTALWFVILLQDVKKVPAKRNLSIKKCLQLPHKILHTDYPVQV